MWLADAASCEIVAQRHCNLREARSGLPANCSEREHTRGKIGCYQVKPARIRVFAGVGAAPSNWRRIRSATVNGRYAGPALSLRGLLGASGIGSAANLLLQGPCRASWHVNIAFALLVQGHGEGTHVGVLAREREVCVRSSLNRA